MSTQTNVVRVTAEGVKRKIFESVEIPILTRCCFCLPLRKGIIAASYINLIWLFLHLGMISYLTYLHHKGLDLTEYPRLIIDAIGTVLDILMTLMFIVALHKKHAYLMRVYMYFKIVIAVIGFIDSVAFMTREIAVELMISILLSLVQDLYLAILTWSSIVKMERDGTVKYTREREVVI